MHLPEIPNGSVNDLLSSNDLVEETVAQIIKDFRLFDISIAFSGDILNAYREILEQLTRQIEVLLIDNYGKLLSILYQIDVSEKEIEKSHAEIPHYSLPEIVSHQIIVRELKKVLTRRYFKAQQG